MTYDELRQAARIAPAKITEPEGNHFTLTCPFGEVSVSYGRVVLSTLFDGPAGLFYKDRFITTRNEADAIHAALRTLPVTEWEHSWGNASHVLCWRRFGGKVPKCIRWHTAGRGDWDDAITDKQLSAFLVLRRHPGLIESAYTHTGDGGTEDER